METTPELIIFLVVGFVAVIAAVLMLISENAVHSALFLILNFACVAFLFLMLQAAFLAMVQVAVYAGAIMVLFMFVIMLLGAERLTPETTPRFPWLTPAAVVLTMVFLLGAGITILQSEISSTEPEPLKPLVRVINVAPQFERVDVLVGDRLVADGLKFRADSELTEFEAGEYGITAIGHSADGSETPLTLSLVWMTDPAGEMNFMEQVAENLEGDSTALQPALQLGAAALTLQDNDDITLVLTPLADGTYGVIPVKEDFNTVKVSKTANIQLVHAVATAGAIDLAEVSQADRPPRVIYSSVDFGEVTPIETKRSGNSQYAMYEAGLIAKTQARLTEPDEMKVSDVAWIEDVEETKFTPNSSTLYVIAPPLRSDIPGQHPDLLHYVTDNRPAFGGPASVGQLLFTTYMLPFQVIALLLLVAMVGAIVLTRDAVPPPRKRFPRRLANVSEQSSSQD